MHIFLKCLYERYIKLVLYNSKVSVISIIYRNNDILSYLFVGTDVNVYRLSPIMILLD